MFESLALSMLEAACDLSEDVPGVLQRIARAGSGLAPRGPVSVCTFDAAGLPDPASSHFEHADDDFVRAFRAGSEAMPTALRRQLQRLPPTVMEPGTVHVESFPAHLRPQVRELTPLAIMANTGVGDGLLIGFSDPCVWKWPAAQLRALQATAEHLAATWRLRRALTSITAPHVVAAELKTDGTDLNLARAASTPVARDALRTAVVARERARAGKRSTQGQPLWPALVLGRWSLLDAFTASGARYVVAYENPPESAWLRALPAREHAVLEHALAGRSGKWIALELDLSEPTVTRALRAALRRLGAADMAAAAGIHAALFEPLDSIGSDHSLAVARLTEIARLALLTPAERAVALGVLRGRRVSEIASERSISARTVGNQLASIYRKLGVASRRELVTLLS